ncbi:MAG: N-acyl homoserine lactonase family protein [Pseudomonadota bacterium]
MNNWEIYALRYAQHLNRPRSDNFIFEEDPHSDGPLDFFIWVVKNDTQTILVDTGFEAEEAARRGRAVDRDPVEALAALDIDASTLETVIVTHLHFDHAGGLDRYPAAKFHLQETEMAYATGPCMCHAALQRPFTVEHVVEMVRHVYSGRVIFHDGDAEVAPGVTVHRIGGHSRGLQAVRVETADGPVCLASDASHLYENFEKGKLFPIVADVEDMLHGFTTIRRLAGGEERVIPGHDPLVTKLYPVFGTSGFVWRLDKGRV